MLSVLLTYVMTVFMFLMMPGPVNLVVVNTAAKHGIKGAWFAIMGTNLASLVLILAASLMIVGIGRVNEVFLSVLTGLGGAYLVYYGVCLWRDAAVSEPSLHAASQPLPFSAIKLVRHTFLVGASNPKDVMFFTAFFPPFIQQLNLDFLPALVLLTVIWCILDYAILLAYGLGVARIMTSKRQYWLHKICSFLFVGIGVYAIVQMVFSL